MKFLTIQNSRSNSLIVKVSTLTNSSRSNDNVRARTTSDSEVRSIRTKSIPLYLTRPLPPHVKTILSLSLDIFLFCPPCLGWAVLLVNRTDRCLGKVVAKEFEAGDFRILSLSHYWSYSYFWGAFLSTACEIGLRLTIKVKSCYSLLSWSRLLSLVAVDLKN